MKTIDNVYMNNEEGGEERKGDLLELRIKKQAQTRMSNITSHML
jgi:hypothetical protein